MSTQESSLSAAIRSLADFLSSSINEDVVVTVGTPREAYKRAKTANTPILNIFAYNIGPADIRASESLSHTLHLRASVLITAFAAIEEEPAVELRVLGHAIQLMHSSPVTPVSIQRAAPGSEVTQQQGASYRLQAALRSCPVEELAHIWSTQGGEVPYRLSIAYELGQIPIEPQTHSNPEPTPFP